MEANLGGGGVTTVITGQAGPIGVTVGPAITGIWRDGALCQRRVWGCDVVGEPGLSSTATDGERAVRCGADPGQENRRGPPPLAIDHTGLDHRFHSRLRQLHPWDAWVGREHLAEILGARIGPDQARRAAVQGDDFTRRPGGAPRQSSQRAGDRQRSAGAPLAPAGLRSVECCAVPPRVDA